MVAAENQQLIQPLPQIDHVVVLVHGIRDRAPWVQIVDKALGGNGIKVVGVRYGRFSALKFLAPIDFSERPLSLIDRTFRQVRKQHPDAKISVIAHSFGTHLVARLLQRDDTLKFWRVIVCGSVLEQDFNWGRVEHQIVGMEATPGQLYKVLNDCGNADIWPVLGASAGWRFGSAGTDAFGSTYVCDRFHNGGHGLFLQADFIKTYWEPFIRNGIIVPGEATQGEKVPWYIRAVAAIPLRYLQFVLPLIVAAALACSLTINNAIEPAPASFETFANRLGAFSTEDSISDFNKDFLSRRTLEWNAGQLIPWEAVVVDTNESEKSYTVWHDYEKEAAPAIPSDTEYQVKTDPPRITLRVESESDFRDGIKKGRRLQIDGLITIIRPLIHEAEISRAKITFLSDDTQSD